MLSAGAGDSPYTWSNSYNWTPEGAPGPGGAAVINTSNPSNIIVDDLATLTTLNSLALGADADLLVNTGATLTVNALSLGADSTLEAESANFTLQGPLTAASDATLTAGLDAVVTDDAPSDPGAVYSVQDGGELILAAPVAATSELIYGSSNTGGPGGTIVLENPGAQFSGTISGFTVGDTINLSDVKYDSAWTAGIEPDSDNVLQFVENGTTYTLDLDPTDDFVGHDFLLSSIDSGAGTSITVGQVPITGTVTVPAGDTVSDVIIGSGGELDVGSGATAIGTTVDNGATLDVENGGNASGGTVDSGGTLNVENGGSSDDMTVDDGGHQNVEAGGIANNTVLTDPGVQIVEAGATANNTVDGGEQDVYGTANGTSVINGGLEIIEDGGTADTTSVSTSGTLMVDSGGTLEDVTTLAGDGEVILEAGAILSSGASFDFSGTGNTLQIDGAQSAGAVLPGITITSFQQGDTIDLTGIAYGTPNSIGPVAGGELPFTEGGVTYDLPLAGNYTGQTFYLSPDSAGPDAGTDITVVPCYCRGTRIDTERGETAVRSSRSVIGYRPYRARFVRSMDRAAQLWRPFHHGPQRHFADLHQGRCAR